MDPNTTQRVSGIVGGILVYTAIASLPIAIVAPQMREFLMSFLVPLLASIFGLVVGIAYMKSMIPHWIQRVAIVGLTIEVLTALLAVGGNLIMKFSLWAQWPSHASGDIGWPIIFREISMLLVRAALLVCVLYISKSLLKTRNETIQPS